MGAKRASSLFLAQGMIELHGRRFAVFQLARKGKGPAPSAKRVGEVLSLEIEQAEILVILAGGITCWSQSILSFFQDRSRGLFVVSWACLAERIMGWRDRDGRWIKGGARLRVARID